MMLSASVFSLAQEGIEMADTYLQPWLPLGLGFAGGAMIGLTLMLSLSVLFPGG